MESSLQNTEKIEGTWQVSVISYVFRYLKYFRITKYLHLTTFQNISTEILPWSFSVSHLCSASIFRACFRNYTPPISTFGLYSFSYLNFLEILGWENFGPLYMLNYSTPASTASSQGWWELELSNIWRARGFSYLLYIKLIPSPFLNHQKVYVQKSFSCTSIDSLSPSLTCQSKSMLSCFWIKKFHCSVFSRTNRNATSLLTLLNTYQEKHLVEILSYHSCDSQTRNPPDLDCLIRLQAQNARQRHIVFLTGRKPLLSMSF